MRTCRLWGIAALVVMFTCSPAPGQPVLFDGPVFQPAGVAEAESDELPGSVTLRESGALGRRLTQVDRIIEDGKYAEAAELLGRLAEAVEEDVFVRTDAGRRSLRSFRGEVQRRIAQLPADGRTAYELAYGRAARRMLINGAVDRTLLERVATVYLHTEAGAESLYRLALLRRDQGSLADAAACLERLVEQRPDAVSRFEPHLWNHLAACRLGSGDRAGAEAALALLFPDGERHDAGSRGSESSAGELLARLSQELSAGAAEGDGPSAVAGHPFLSPRWSEEISNQRESQESDEGWPSGVPCVVGALVLVPTPAGFEAHDFETGARLWSYPSDETAPGSGGRSAGPTMRRLSTGGRGVFLVEQDVSADVRGALHASTDNGAVVQRQVAFFAAPFAMPAAPPLTAPAPVNSLTALDVKPPRQGNRLWRVGGALGIDERRLAGHWFLGPPLSARGRLYAMTERAGTTRLVVLDAETGRLDWSLDLADAETPLATDPQRMRMEVTPTLAGSIVFCPTGGGAVVAVDAASRSLVWGFRYPRSTVGTGGSPNAGAAADGTPREWLSGTVHVADGSVLLTPPESSQLYCLDRKSGELQWQRGRDDHLYLAGVDEASGRALLVGAAAATLLELADGSTVAGELSFPEGSSPSGLGYWKGGFYVQPLSDGSLFQVELAAAEAEVIARSTRGITPGNLLWHEGSLVSVGSDFLRLFDDRQRLEGEVSVRLAADPQDAGALLRRADLHSEAGRHLEAIADARGAYAGDPSPVAKARLVASLLDGVRLQLPGREQFEEELERLAVR